MIITAIIGSLRKDSLHRKLFNQYREIASDLFNLTEGAISEIPMFDGTNFNDPAVSDLADQIRKSDGVIFFSPEYNYSYTGYLKNALDCLSLAKPQPFAGKVATIIGATPGSAGTARMQYDLRKVGGFFDLHFLNKPEVMISNIQGKTEGDKVTDEDTLAHLRKHAEAFAIFAGKFS